MFDDLQEIFSQLQRNKMRTALTGLSVSMGIFLLIFLLGAGNGLIHAFEHNTNNFAMNVVQVWPGFTSVPYDGLESGRNIEFDNRDIALTEKAFPEKVTAVAGQLSKSGVMLIKDNVERSASLKGCFPENEVINKIKIQWGRYLNDIDLSERRKVMVLDEKTASDMFHSPQAALGQNIRVDDAVFKLVGIYANRGMFGESEVHIPFTTLQTIYNQGTQVHQLTLQTQNVETEEADNEFQKDLRRALGNVHRFDPNDKSAIWIWNTTTGAHEQNTAKNILRTALWVVGLLTLLSGVVGISNIMLITVKERTREFGIRKALGARPWQILRGVLAESILITAFFGYIGLIAGVAATEYMNVVAGQQSMSVVADTTMYVFLNPTIDINIALRSLLVLIVSGLLAGFIPARKAVSVKPVIALNAR